MNSSIVAINLSRVVYLVDEVNNLSNFLLLHIQDKKLMTDVRLAREETKEFGKAWPKLWNSFLLNFIYRKFPI